MNRHCRVFCGWPTHLLGVCKVEVSAREENYAVVCYEGDEAKDGFLIFEIEKVGVIIKSWLMGMPADEIDARFVQ